MTRWTLDWAHAYPRKVKAGESEAYLGALDVIVISKPFTAGEDAVMSWVNAQDGVELSGITPIPDGRDLMLLTRQHTRQSLSEAVLEVQRWTKALLTFDIIWRGTRHDTPERDYDTQRG